MLKENNKSTKISNVNVIPATTSVIVIMGRFQPFTLGHEKILKEARKMNKKLAIVVVEQSKTAGEKSPFDFDFQIKMLDELIEKNDIIVRVGTGFIGDFITILRNLGFEPNFLMAGADRAEGYRKQINRYEKQFNLSMEVIEVERCLSDVSATRVREALMLKDKKKFKKLMPKKLHEFFEPLMEKICQSHHPTQ